MSKTDNIPARAPVELLVGHIYCPNCHRKWPAPCEQAVAIQKRNMCIVCLVAKGHDVFTNPYEFHKSDFKFYMPNDQVNRAKPAGEPQ